MPRALWTGSITFGLVSAPVRMYPAIREHDLELHLVHVPDGSPIGYRKYCKEEDRAVPDDEVAKAYEVDGELVLLDEEDFAAAEGEAYKTIEILDFVPLEQIDPIYFERTYYLGPQKGSEKVYALLVAALEEAGLAGIVRYVFHDRDALACLRIRERMLVLERMYFADEIRPADDVVPSRRVQVDPRELEMALSLVERFTGEFDPETYEDRYRERLLEVIEEKRRGGETTPAPREEPKETPDLLAALKESLERAQGGRRQARGDGNGRPRRRTRRLSLEEWSAKELGERARELGVEGRSKMTKRQLVSAIRKAER